MAEKDGFDKTKFIFQNLCVRQYGAVVREFFHACTSRRTGFDSRRRYFLFLCIVYLFVCLFLVVVVVVVVVV